MIYFVRLGPDGPIKIGCTTFLEWRLEHFRSTYSLTKEQIILLMTMDGDRSIEEQVHRQFASFRLGRSEQFRPGPELTDFLGLPRVPDWQSIERRPQYKSPNPVVSIRLTKRQRAKIRRIVDRSMGGIIRTDTGRISWLIRCYAARRAEKEKIEESAK